MTAGEILRQCRFFSQVQARGMELLESMAVIREYKKGELVFRERQECPGVFVVGSGMVRIYKTAPNGKEHVLHMVAPGQTFAEVAAIGQFACPAFAEAIAPTVCVLLPTDSFRKALEDSHGLCLEIMASLTFWVRQLVSQVEDMALRDAVGRLARYLVESPTQPDGTIALPSLKRHLASHLNLTSETFSRTLGRLIESGLVVELDGNRLELRDRDALRRLAGTRPFALDDD
jgi:CRP/FNR family transcriptional regulator, dissimilatory nitrate respiration regulator